MDMSKENYHNMILFYKMQLLRCYDQYLLFYLKFHKLASISFAHYQMEISENVLQLIIYSKLQFLRYKSFRWTHCF